MQILQLFCLSHGPRIYLTNIELIALLWYNLLTTDRIDHNFHREVRTMLEGLSSVLGNVSGGDVFGTVLKGLAYMAAALTALFGVLYKLNKLPFTWLPAYKTAVRTSKGELRVKRPRSEDRLIIEVPVLTPELVLAQLALEDEELPPLRGALKRTRHGFVFFVPYGKPIEEFDHRPKSQALQPIKIEAKDGSQWETQPTIRSFVGKTDEDIWKVWHREDADAQVRTKMGMAIHNAIRAIDPKVLHAGTEDFSVIFTEKTRAVRAAIYEQYGIKVVEVLFPTGITRTDVDAVRGLGSNVFPAVLPRNGNGHRPVDA